MVTCVNLIKAIAVFLKPVVPNIIAALEKQYGAQFAWDDYRFSLRNGAVGKTEKLVVPITEKDFAKLLGAQASGSQPEEHDSREGESGVIDIKDFSRIDLRVGVIEEAERVEKSNKLIRLIVNDGDGKRQLVAGIGEHYEPGTLVGTRIVFVANLKPAKLMGVESQGMLLAAQKDNTMALVRPDSDIAAGASVS
jgi:methionyl-tRNA synthetase